MIPLSVPNLSGNEWKYVKECLDTGWISSVGAYVTQFESEVARFCGAKYGVAAVNGTSAIHLALSLVGVSQGDQVIVPNITFVASCNAIVYTGAEPLLIDVDPDTWQMDLDLLEQFLSEATYLSDQLRGEDRNVYCFNKKSGQRIAALLPVHVLGNMCDMDRLLEIADKYHLSVIEDSTEALGSYYKERHAGTFGRMGTFSFNGNKIVSTGGGGVIVTDDEILAKKAKHLTTQAKADAFEYVHDDVGYNYRLVNLLAAVGVAQMEQLPGFLLRKQEIDLKYRSALEGKHDFRFQAIGKHVKPNNWLHTMQTVHQKGMIKHLLDHEISCRPFWVPMNQLPMYKHHQFVSAGDRSGFIYSTCLSIPSSTSLTDQQVDTVIETILKYEI